MTCDHSKLVDTFSGHQPVFAGSMSAASCIFKDMYSSGMVAQGPVGKCAPGAPLQDAGRAPSSCVLHPSQAAAIELSRGCSMLVHSPACPALQAELGTGTLFVSP
jgi:hypothetical protein